ncbi:MAG TPA: FAD-dependent oxidoreductase [Xanthobacteraceae bacterium]|nr:FAD-dependent oxidoreductase [Xanthobacteraceae bacterium]
MVAAQRNGDLPHAASADVIVVGAGGAGMAAALTAAEAGAKVLILEQLSGPDGTTSRAVGSFAAAATSLQRRAGIADTAGDFAEDMAKAHALAVGAPELRAMYAEHSGETVDWLESLGVAFVGPYPEPPNRVPRMHNAVPNGKAYLQAMEARAKRLPIRIVYDAPVTGLIRQYGAVVGVNYRQGTQTLPATAPAVIMAAGDFSASDELRGRYVSPAAAAALPINPHSLGTGHSLLIDAGADMRQMDMLFGPQLRFAAPSRDSWINRLPRWRWFRKLAALAVASAPRWAIAPVVRELLISNMSPVPALFEQGAHLIDKAGNDLGSGPGAVDALAMAPGCAGYVLGSGALADRFNRFPNYVSTAPGIAFAYFRDYESGRPDLVHRAPSLADLARRLGLDPAALARRFPQFAQGPVFALGPVMAMLTVTEGGAAVDTQCRILTADGTPIPGLFGAGGTGQGGLVLKGHGLHIGWAITSGRMAGRTAAGLALSAK